MAKRRKGTTKEKFDCLLTRAQQGQLPAREEIFQFLYTRFSRLARRRLDEEDAHDIVQETLMVVDHHFANMRGVEELLIFTDRVLRNKIGNFYRKRDWRGQFQASWEEVPELVYDFEGEMDAMDLVETVMRALDKLDQRSLRCRKIILALIEGASIVQVSQQFQLSRAKTDYWIYWCRKALREILEEEYGLRV